MLAQDLESTLIRSLRLPPCLPKPYWIPSPTSSSLITRTPGRRWDAPLSSDGLAPCDAFFKPCHVAVGSNHHLVVCKDCERSFHLACECVASRVKCNKWWSLGIKPPSLPEGRYTQILSVGIGGSALGPQFVAEALAPDNPPLKHLKEPNDPIMEGVLVEIENMLARGRMDLPLSVCFVATRGDDLLLHKLLKRGMDPNESDNNRRTALVGE
ncbi:hypothetical protein LR48_Vigan04g096100 [Vigna angularis]|uniref:Uncharacterized protein n=1 Tax=Phaseolus angularis TaxID=3914 RepID=A0A0L9UDD0_PHAAN|nr:hypothetical protein LR48_Vigan04g096100 [Vigna angularis]